MSNTQGEIIETWGSDANRGLWFFWCVAQPPTDWLVSLVWGQFQGNMVMNDCSQWVLDFISMVVTAQSCSSVFLWRGQRFVALFPSSMNPHVEGISVGVWRCGFWSWGGKLHAPSSGINFWESSSCWRLTLGRPLYLSSALIPPVLTVILEDVSAGRHDGWGFGWVEEAERGMCWSFSHFGSCHFLDVAETWLNGWMEWSWK